MRSVLVVTILLLGTVGTATVGTATATAQSAEELLDEGVRLREQGQDEAALDHFRRAHRLQPTAQSLIQISLAEQALGRYAEAERHLLEALEQRRHPFIRRNRRALRASLEEIRNHVGELELAGGLVGAEVLIDGEPVCVLPIELPLRLTEGERQILVRAPGRASYERAVDIAPQVRLRVDIGEMALADAPSQPGSTPEASPPAGPPVSAQDPAAPVAASSDPTLTIVGGVLLATGGVGAIVGTAFLLVRESHASQRATCSDTDPDCLALYQAALDAETAAIVAFAATGALIAAGVVLLIVGSLDDGGQSASLACAPGLGSLSCHGRF